MKLTLLYIKSIPCLPTPYLNYTVIDGRLASLSLNKILTLEMWKSLIDWVLIHGIVKMNCQGLLDSC